MDYSLDGLAVLSTFVSETGNVQKIVALCQGRLNEKIALLEQLALEANNNNTTTLRDVKQAINDTTQEMKEISEALGTVRGRWFVRAPANERSTTKAKQVFETTELLELILLNLGTQDLMQAQLVNRTMRTTITASIALQNLLFLRAEPSDAFFRGLGLYHPSASISFHCYADPYGFRNPTLNFSRNENEVEVTAKFESGFHSRNLPKLGGRLRSMFICQPPLKEMKPAVRCCSAHTPRTVAAAQARVIELEPSPVRQRANSRRHPRRHQEVKRRAPSVSLRTRKRPRRTRICGVYASLQSVHSTAGE